jgi:glycosyltransferase involved in cell wall biosynthesis
VTGVPDLTVVVPTYNGRQLLSPTLESLARQQDVDLEVLVVDDGSIDGSPVVAEAHRVGARVIRQRNLGVAVARNRGLAEARAPWVAFLDQDDLWHPRRAHILLELAERQDAKMVGSTERAFALQVDRSLSRPSETGGKAGPTSTLTKAASSTNSSRAQDPSSIRAPRWSSCRPNAFSVRRRR